MVMLPKDALQRAKDALDLTWTAEQQLDAVAGVVEKLASELSSAEPLLRTVQVLWLPDGAKDRVSAKRVLTLLAEASGMLAQGPSALGWAKVAAWAALRVGVEKDAKVAAVVSLMRSAAEWTSVPTRYGELLHELIGAARDAITSAHIAPAPVFSVFAKWPSQASMDQARAQPAAQEVIAGWSSDPTKLHAALLQVGLVEDALFEAVHQIEAHLVRPPSVESLEFLWWGQSLYSQRLHKSYRDLSPNQRLFWMADDMAALGSHWPSEQRVAYFAETLRRAGLDLDVSHTLREYVQEVVAACNLDGDLCAPPDALARAIEADPTGLPTSLLSVGTRKGISCEILLASLKSKLDMDLDREIPLRQWATWVCRERLLLRFLSSTAS